MEDWNESVKCLVASQHLKNDPLFLKAVENLAVGYRELSLVDIEICPDFGAVFSIPSREKLSEALIKYQNILILYFEGSITDQTLYQGVSYRQMPSKKLLYASICSYAVHLPFFRKDESLHEQFLASFPTISHLMAMYLLHNTQNLNEALTFFDEKYAAALRPFHILQEASVSYGEPKLKRKQKKAKVVKDKIECFIPTISKASSSQI